MLVLAIKIYSSYNLKLIGPNKKKSCLLLINTKLATDGHKGSIKISNSNQRLSEMYLVVHPVWAFLFDFLKQVVLGHV